MNRHCVLLTSEFPPLAIGGVGRYVYEVASRLSRSMRVTVALVPTYQALRHATHGSSPLCDTNLLSLSDREAIAGDRDYWVDVAGSEYRDTLLEINGTHDFKRMLDAAQTVASQCSKHVHRDEELILYVQDYALAPIAAALRERFPLARVLAACHLPVSAGFTYFDKPISDAVHQVLEAKLVHLAHRVVVPSTFAAHVLTLTHNVARGKLVVVPLGVCRPGPVQPFSEGPLRLLAVGRATEQKGYHFLLDTFRQLREWDKATRLTIATGMECRDRLSFLAERYGVEDNVDLEQPVAHDAVWRLYDRHHLLVTTSLYETFGLAVLEAMASGRPTLGFRVGALPELWGEMLSSRFATPVARVDRLLARIKSVAANIETRDELGRCAARRAGEFSWVRHVERLGLLMHGASKPAPALLPA